jgi:hypothetical protein
LARRQSRCPAFSGGCGHTARAQSDTNCPTTGVLGSGVMSEAIRNVSRSPSLRTQGCNRTDEATSGSCIGSTSAFKASFLPTRRLSLRSSDQFRLSFTSTCRWSSLRGSPSSGRIRPTCSDPSPDTTVPTPVVCLRRRLSTTPLPSGTSLRSGKGEPEGKLVDLAN